MKLDKKKELAARTLKVGKNKIVFNISRLDEIKEVITKQDIKDLLDSKAISIKESRGRKKIVKRKTRRRIGSRKKKINTRKQDYVKRTRKLRTYLSNMKKKGTISQEDFLQLRKEIRTSAFKSLAQMKERMKGDKKWKSQEEEG